jgi:hypothetical protein
MSFLHAMTFAVPACGVITAAWALACRFLWRQSKPVEEP